MKDGTTHLAYKPEHAVDLDTGAVVAAVLHPADEGDTTTLAKTVAAAQERLEAVDLGPTPEAPAECVTDKGYHSRAVLKALDGGPWKTRIAEPKAKGFARWRGDEAASARWPGSTATDRLAKDFEATIGQRRGMDHGRQRPTHDPQIGKTPKTFNSFRVGL